MNRTTRIVGTILLVGITGCVSTLREECYNAGAQVCIEVDAHHAWWDYKSNCKQDVCHIRDFGCGFRSGYLNVASGGDGRRPLVAPQKYWSHCYANSVGQAKQVAWFNGYSAGAIYALQSGANSGHHLVLSDCNIPPCSQCSQLHSAVVTHDSHDGEEELLFEPDEPPVDVPEPQSTLTPSAPPEPPATDLPGLIEPKPWRPSESKPEDNPLLNPPASGEVPEKELGSGLIGPDLRVPRFDAPVASGVSAQPVQPSIPEFDDAEPLLADPPAIPGNAFGQTIDIQPATKLTQASPASRFSAVASRDFHLSSF